MQAANSLRSGSLGTLEPQSQSKDDKHPQIQDLKKLRPMSSLEKLRSTDIKKSGVTVYNNTGNSVG